MGTVCAWRMRRPRLVGRSHRSLKLRQLPWQTALFGTPAAVPWQSEGFVPPAEAWTDRPYLWLRKSAELRLPGSPAAPRCLLLELAPHPATRGQAVEINMRLRRRPRVAPGA